MNMQKKLKRGLADLSIFFAEPVPAQQKNRIGLLAIQPPETPNFEKPSKPSLITASILSCSPSFQISDLMEFTEAIKYYFAGVHFVTLTGGEEGPYENRIGDKDIHYERISWDQLEPLTQPQIQTYSFSVESNTDKALALFDSGLYGSMGTDAIVSQSLFEVLDHCILAVEADTKQLMHGYQVMKMALSRNPNLHYSLLVVGKRAEHFSEFIYEHFSELISQFLGHNLGFLGWMENREICVNPELLKDEADSIFIRCSKMHLSHLLYPPHLITSER